MHSYIKIQNKIQRNSKKIVDLWEIISKMKMRCGTSPIINSDQERERGEREKRGEGGGETKSKRDDDDDEERGREVWR